MVALETKYQQAVQYRQQCDRVAVLARETCEQFKNRTIKVRTCGVHDPSERGCRTHWRRCWTFTSTSPASHSS